MTQLDGVPELSGFVAKSFLAVVLTTTLSCGDNLGGATTLPDGSPTEDLLQPPAPGTGFQVSLKTKIGPGEEHEYCKFYKVPESWAVRDQVKFSPGSHHVLLYATNYADIPTTKDDGTALVLDVNGVFDCSDGATNGISVTAVTGGSQNRNGDSVLNFPPGVAVKTTAVVLINAHYINATDRELEPEARINIYTIPQSEVQVEGGMLFLYQQFIHVPAMGTSTARWSCPVYQDLKLYNVQSHMHARGVGYQAELVDGTNRTMLYQTDSWESVPTKNYPGEGLLIKKGSRFDYHCNYKNDQPREVFQGPRASDEMCMLVGSYYPRDDRSATCLNEAGTGGGGEWIGSGTKTCGETFGCIQADPNLNNAARCIAQSKPAVSKVLSAAVNCFLDNEDPLMACVAEVNACTAM
jgi:hypothetical protein